MTNRELVFVLLSGIGLLAMSIGAFGLLDAFHQRNRAVRRVDWLIALYALGVALNIAGHTVLGRWYVAAPLALMLVPAELAMRRRGSFRRRGERLNDFR